MRSAYTRAAFQSFFFNQRFCFAVVVIWSCLMQLVFSLYLPGFLLCWFAIAGAMSLVPIAIIIAAAFAKNRSVVFFCKSYAYCCLRHYELICLSVGKFQDLGRLVHEQFVALANICLGRQRCVAFACWNLWAYTASLPNQYTDQTIYNLHNIISFACYVCACCICFSRISNLII